MNKITFSFAIDVPGERAAGIVGYTDLVDVAVHSGDAGGVPGEFAEHMQQALAEWHDGGRIICTSDPTMEVRRCSNCGSESLRNEIGFALLYNGVGGLCLKCREE